MTGLVSIIITLLVVGLILWLINTYIPLQPPFKKIINVVVIIALIVWLVQKFLPGIL